MWDADAKGGISWFCSSLITEVNLSLSCPERRKQILILQSQANLTWSLSVNNCDIQLLVGLSRTFIHVPSPRGLPAAQEMPVSQEAGHLWTLGMGRWQPPHCKPS